MLAAGTVDLDWLHHLNWVDYLFLVIAVYSVVTGAWIGFMAECISLAGVVAGTAVAGQVYNGAGTLLGHLGVPKDSRDWAGFVAVFALIFIVFRVLSVLARKLSQMMVRGPLNILTGGIIGALSGTLLCLFIVTAVTYFRIPKMYDPTMHAQLTLKTTSWLNEFVTLLPDKMRQIPGLIGNSAP